LLPPDSGPAGVLPNTLPMLYRPFGNRIVLDHIGGCTANALLGRFSLCGREYHNLCRDIAGWEAAANPDADFFDVGYQAEGHTDNINRRLPVYALELPVNSWPQGAALRLADILVMVRNGEFILVHQLSGRRLVPRMATAYNFTRSPLSVFRFLGDLQYQGLVMPALPDLTALFPGQAHYSRLSYQSVILCPETWMVPHGLVTGRPDDAKRVRDWLSARDIHSPFRAGTGDQTLVFSPGSEEDIEMFTEFCRQRKASDTYIAEALTGQGTGVEDQHGKAYASQFLALVTHPANVYPKASAVSPEVAGNVQRQCIPGGEWLCFEIYSHSSVMADILMLEVNAFLREVKAQLRQWFFIRYEENGPHLRLRLECKAADSAGELLSQLHRMLERRVHAGAVRDIKVVTYHRELERYGHLNMATVERFFHQDSLWVLGLLKRKLSGEQRYAHTLKWMTELVVLAYATPAEQLQFARTMAGLFAREFSWTTADFRQINRLFPASAELVKQGMPAGIRRAWIALDDQLTEREQKQRMLADLIHLHINRLFAEDQRRHEGILYQFLFSDRKKQCRFPVS
jgi:thiopeptide-type bacteriocin biosynthesis protein